MSDEALNIYWILNANRLGNREQLTLTLKGGETVSGFIQSLDRETVCIGTAAVNRSIALSDITKAIES